MSKLSAAAHAINELLAAAPGPFVAVEVRLVWFDEKTRVFDLIAEEDPFQADEWREVALKARTDAAGLRQAE